MGQVQKVPLISFELILIFISWRFGSVIISLQCDHANNNKSGFNKVIHSDTSTRHSFSHQADSSQWQDQLSSNVNLTTLIKHENLQRTSSKRLVSLRAAFWKNSGGCNTFGYFSEYLQANKSLFIRVFWNAKILPSSKMRSWYKLPIVQHFLFNPAAPWKGSHSQSHKVKCRSHTRFLTRSIIPTQISVIIPGRGPCAGNTTASVCFLCSLQRDKYHLAGFNSAIFVENL